MSSRIITPTAYTRPEVVIQPRPEIVIEPRPDIVVSKTDTTMTLLVCDTTPTGAAVTVAAEGVSPYPGGTTPVTLKVLPNIVYTLTYKKEGYKTVNASYLLREGETRTANVILPEIQEGETGYIPPPELPGIEIEPEPTPSLELPKIDVISFTLPPTCVIGEVCKGSIELKNNTDGTLDGTINICMAGAVPVPPTEYSIDVQASETVVFEIPTVGLTITGVYVLELDMYVGTEVVETVTGKLEILPPPEHEVTFNSEPSTATVDVTAV